MPKDDDDYQKHIREREEQPPEFLHKYVTMETARLILGSGKMRFQSPIRYNDPFDSQWDPTWTLKTPEALLFQKQLVQMALQDKSCWPVDMPTEYRKALENEQKRLFALPFNQQTDFIKRFVAEVIDNKESEQHWTFLMQDLRRRLRVLCLSKTQNSVTMWAHYASEHKGVVFTFKSRGLEDDLKRPMQRVCYVNTPPRLVDVEKWYQADVFGLENTAKTADPGALTRTKSRDWKYENEWRLVTIAPKGTLGDYKDLPVPRGSLISLTMGCRADRKAFKDLYTLALAWNCDIKLQEAFIPLGHLQLGFKDLDPTTL